MGVGPIPPNDAYSAAESNSRFAPGVYDVRDYGAVLDGTTDDSGALIAALAAMRAAGSGHVLVRNGTMGLASTVKIGSGARILWDDVRIESSVSNGPALWITASSVEMAGRLTIDCNAATASTGLRVQGTTDFGASGPCTHCDLSALNVTVLAATDRSFDISSDPAVGNTILNRFGKLRSYQGTGVGLELRTTSGSVGYTNANDFAFVSIQSHTTGTPLRVDEADGNHFQFLEIENCTGPGIFAIDLVNAVGFYVDGGWIEGNTGNIRIANANAVLAVYITAQVDSQLTSSDPKFSYTYSGNRSVEIKSGTDARYGLFRAARVQVGIDGVAANDQSVRNLAVSGGMECYRYSSGTGLFYFKGQQAGMGYFFDDGTTGILEMNTTRIQAQNATRIETGAAGVLRTGRNVTGSRPSASSQGNGSMFYDTTLSKPIWSDGTVWRDATGTAV